MWFQRDCDHPPTTENVSKPTNLHLEMNQCEFTREIVVVSCVDLLLAQCFCTFLLLYLVLLTMFVGLADKQATE